MPVFTYLSVTVNSCSPALFRSYLGVVILHSFVKKEGKKEKKSDYVRAARKWRKKL